MESLSRTQAAEIEGGRVGERKRERGREWERERRKGDSGRERGSEVEFLAGLDLICSFNIFHFKG